MQNNTNSIETTNIKVGSLIGNTPTFLGDMLETPEGAIHAKNLLNNVFTTFFASENFCERHQDSRWDYTAIFEDIQRWIDLSHAEQMTAKAEAELERSIEAIESMKQNLLDKKKNARA